MPQHFLEILESRRFQSPSLLILLCPPIRTHRMEQYAAHCQDLSTTNNRSKEGQFYVIVKLIVDCPHKSSIFRTIQLRVIYTQRVHRNLRTDRDIGLVQIENIGPKQLSCGTLCCIKSGFDVPPLLQGNLLASSQDEFSSKFPGCYDKQGVKLNAEENEPHTHRPVFKLYTTQASNSSIDISCIFT